MRNVISNKRCLIALFSAVVMSTLAGCGEGTVVEDPPLADPQNKQICNASYSLAGQLTLERPKPADVIGCWPVGIWSITPTLNTDANSCAGTPMIFPKYEFKVTRTPSEDGTLEGYELITNPNKLRYKAKVTSGGGALCEGHLEIFSDSGTEVFNVTASLQDDQTISGFADYTVFEKDQWPLN